ncbi:MAG TPA: hypothetical protein VN429_11435 [Methanospirillum sp.]|uniref:hypothetical protein n=1 Tax=Methanospirillum sp. TaxID=45200 RepID=UPI002C88C0AF|nr:hypothetical protein [Methanospirillum sp.]HWQ65021.1 hypothetical protein [Methanospirillum sp.]
MSLISAEEIAQLRSDLLQTGAFDKSCTFQQAVTTTSPSGGKITTWKAVTELTNIPGYLWNLQATRKNASNQILTYNAVRVRLSGYYPAVAIGQHVVIGSDTWEVIDIVSDSQQAFTTLEVQRWKV